MTAAGFFPQNASMPSWMTVEAFAPGGPLERATDAARAQHGARALHIWLTAITQYADGRVITTKLIVEHSRQSLHCYAIWRAACYASVDARFAPVGGEPRARTKALQSPRGPSAAARSIREQLGWGRR